MILAPVTGEDGQHFLTVENCGGDFLFALADAIQGLEDCDDLEVIESKTHGCSNGTVINSLSDDKGGVAATNLLEFRKAEPFTSKKVKENLSAS